MCHMKWLWLNKVPFILLLIACFPICSDAGITRQQNGRDKRFDFLLLAQFWPGTSCIYFNDSGCLVPPGLKGWTIHGLWPSTYSDPRIPECCNDSMKFNYDEIKPLHYELNKQWPYLNNSDDRLYLWSHEWDTHGTCAYYLPILRGEMRYFRKALQLHRGLDIYDTLSKANIIPADEQKKYNLTSIFTAIVNVFDKKPQIKCFSPKNRSSTQEKKYYLEQIYQCFDKTFNLIDCPEVALQNDRSSVSKRTCSEKPRTDLNFASEKYKPDNKPNVDNGGYFIECPDDGQVSYVPIPEI